MHRTILVPSLAAVICSCLDAFAQEPGDPIAGKSFVAEACSSCHAVKPNQMMSPEANATPFQIIADTSGMTGMALTVWLQTFHPSMPNLQLEQAEKDNAIAYILTLKTKRE